jgi:hypothetical protein
VTGAVALGRYGYLHNASATDIEETWEIHGNAGDRLIRSRRTAPSAGLSIEVESHQLQGVTTRCLIDWRYGAQRVSGDYRFNGQRLSATLRAGKRQHRCDMDLGDAVFFPLLRVFTGATINALLSRGGCGRVLVPWVRDPQDQARLLTPTASTRHATLVRRERVTVAGRRIRCGCFDYSGGEYPPGTLFWVDRHGVLLRYRWQQDPANSWEVSLLDYRPPR